MRVFAFAASNSSKSINRALVTYAVGRFYALTPEAEIEFLDINDYEMPIYSADREAAGGIPAPAQAFFDKIGAADAVLVSFAEHNGSTTAAWKNIFDWMSRINMKVWQDKPVVMLAASPGKRAGTNVLASQEGAAPFHGANVKARHGIGEWHEAWDAEAKRPARDADITAIDRAIACLAPQPA